MARYSNDLLGGQEIDLTEEDDDVVVYSKGGQDGRLRHESEDQETEKKRLMANTQERARMRKINKALDDLRKVLPHDFGLYHRRMSKIRTLRLAMNYIKNMSELIVQDNLRRHSQYMSPGVHCMQTTFPDMTNMSSVQHQPDMDTKTSVSMSPVPFAGMIPVYPYLGPLCMGFNPSQSPYHTPEQAHSRRLTNPRHLNFGSSPHHLEQQQPSCTDGIQETPIKRFRREYRNEYTFKSHRNSFKPPGITIKSETITSPLLGQRNPTEHDSSFVSSTSESTADETIEIRPLQTDGRLVPTGRTLADILNDDEAS